MSEPIQIIIIVSAWCWGVYNAFQEGQILGNEGNWLRERMRQKSIKPLIDCPVCMPSVHGTMLYLTLGIIDGHLDFISWLIVIVCASGLNFIIKEHLYGDKD